MLTVFVILALTIVLFISEKLPLDLIGILALLALYLTGSVTAEQALAGFSNSVVVTLAALFVVGGALFRTGVATRFGTWLGQHAGSGQGRILTLVMLSSAVLSAFMSSTGTVAILIPAVMGVAKKAGISPSRFLLPLAYGCLIGGMLTLVGTPPNLVVQEALLDGGYEKFNFFSFTPMGLVVLLLGTLYMQTVGVHLLSADVDKDPEDDQVGSEELAREYQLEGRVFRARVTGETNFLDQSVEQTALRSRYGINILAIQTCDENSPLQEVEPRTRLASGNILHLHCEPDDFQTLIHEEKLQELPCLEDYPANIVGPHGLAEVLLTPRSRLVGKTLAESRFQARYNVTVISIERLGQLLKNTEVSELRFGDTLLVSGRLEALVGLKAERDSFVVTGIAEESQQVGFRHDRAWVAVLLAMLMLVLMTFGILPSAIAVLAIAAAAVLTGCLSSEDAYRSISWQSLILIAAMLPMAQALETSGGVEVVATALNSQLSPLGPRFVMAGLFLLTSVFSQFISNTATTVIVAPIAMAAAIQSGLAPHAFLMAVSVAASSAFITPVASPVNLLVMAPGKYRFLDFVRVGLPLQLLVMLATLVILPLLFPLR